MSRGSKRRTAPSRALISALAALFLALSSFFTVPHQAEAAEPPAPVAVQDSQDTAPHDHATHQHANADPDIQKPGCADHHKSPAHGGTCCQLTCHAALPALTLPPAGPLPQEAITVAVRILPAPDRIVLIDRPPRAEV